MDELYRENILDHFKHPRNFGKLEDAHATASDNLLSCGDEIKMQIKIDSHNQTIKDIKFQGTGCAISMATASMLTEKVKGETISRLQSWTGNDIFEMLGVTLTPTRVKCAVLSLEVLHKTLTQVK